MITTKFADLAKGPKGEPDRIGTIFDCDDMKRRTHVVELLIFALHCGSAFDIRGDVCGSGVDVRLRLTAPYLLIIRSLFNPDLLTEDYTSKVLLKCKKNAGPVAITIETEAGKGGSLSTKLSHKVSYAKFNVDKLTHAADGSHALETSLVVSPEVKLSFKAGKGADLCVEYLKGNLYATSAIDVMDLSRISSSVCIGRPLQGVKLGGVKFGGDFTYDLSGKRQGLSDFSLGTSYERGPIFAALTTSKLSVYNIGLLYKVNNDLMIGSQTVHSSDKVCTVLALGGAYKVPKVGLIKAKFASNGVVSACVARQVSPGVILTAGGSLSGADLSTFKPGITLQM
jgi:voltage-dependent anion channel protein 2